MELTLVRHFPTANNNNDIFIGTTDISCDFNYICAHKESHIKLFSSYNLQDSLIFCSPLLRTKQTAQVLFPSETILNDNRLLERDLGCWNNKPKYSMRKLYPDAFNIDGRLKSSYTPPNGEPYENVIMRTLAFIKDIHKQSNEGKPVIAITHNGIINTIALTIAVYNHSPYAPKSNSYGSPIVFSLSKMYFNYIDECKIEDFCNYT